MLGTELGVGYVDLNIIVMVYWSWGLQSREGEITLLKMYEECVIVNFKKCFEGQVKKEFSEEEPSSE